MMNIFSLTLRALFPGENIQFPPSGVKSSYEAHGIHPGLRQHSGDSDYVNQISYAWVEADISHTNNPQSASYH